MPIVARSGGTKGQLVYNYMLDGCLDHHLFHGNSENIRLDGNFQLKVEDMGIMKLVGRDYNTVLRGTFWYLVPEWIYGLPIRPKVNVYSFGIMVLLPVLAYDLVLGSLERDC
ncbi:hypothetical protein Taro_027767 [Colocasia esculenta]|uniref:Protein kinase domain-containing protein n=1 Tax=Colocasia esculenta TaxID=4460 RepID=A0A843VGM6_COLES|nr:hypothetical protein [Colocasia esculenta]